MKTKYIVLCLAGVVTLYSSCSKFLDRKPYSQATDQTTWKSDGDVNASVAACYALIRAAFNASITYYAYGDLPTDEFTSANGIGGGDGRFIDIMNVNWGVGVPYANTFDPLLKLRQYNNFYTAIAQSNRCLYFINNMPLSAFTGDDSTAQRARKNHYLGEAYFTRAFNYFYIARVWGDVPLVTDYAADGSTAPQLARSAQKDVLARAIADLNIAKQYLDWQDASSSDRIVRADKGAVFALLAHIYAWERDYDSCNTACDSVINAPNKYDYVDRHNYLDIYQGQSMESIFEIAQNVQSESLVAGLSISGMTLTSPYLANISIPFWPLRGPNALYTDSNDLRFQQAFSTITNAGGTYYSCIKYSKIQNVNSNASYAVAENNIIVFRLADIALLKAEALAARPAPDYGSALAIVNDIRSRAGIQTPLTGITGPALLDAVADERGRELFLEGHRFYDLVRLARNTGTVKFPAIDATAFQQGKYYWPVDPTLFLTNSKLRQTPYWQDKITQ